MPVSGHTAPLGSGQAEVGGHCPLLGQIRRNELKPGMVTSGGRGQNLEESSGYPV